MAQLDARAGDVERAIDELDELIRSTPADPTEEALSGAFERKGPLASLDFDDDRTLNEAHRLRDLIAANDDARYGYDPLCGSVFDSATDRGLLDLDPRSASYLDELRELRTRYSDPPARLLDNIELEIAKATKADGQARDPHSAIAAERIQLLNRLLSDHPDGDAVPEALFRLAVAYRANGQAAASQHTFGRLLAEHSGSIWAEQALAAVHSPIGLGLTDVRTP